MDSGRGSAAHFSVCSGYTAASNGAARQLERSAVDLKGAAYGAWAGQARQRYVDLVLRSEAEDGRAPSSSSIRDAIKDYHGVLKDVYEDLVLEPHFLQDTALASYGGSAAVARLHFCERGSGWVTARRTHTAGEELHNLRMGQRRFIIYRNSTSSPTGVPALTCHNLCPDCAASVACPGGHTCA